ncbi:hypothetical protein MJO28_004667 [Puccinia striiformis f. sp. tritici]|uniref:Uncharacterized protein n=1 Tax=Puccinia striiformis f. sp. tritici TaxID=168172 RepID=A0ACC0EPP7_9BASI|nr:hypothetical protein MJO28_004667 [Puccinia striiformis f. sp. tritici]
MYNVGDLCSKLIYRDMWNVDQFACQSPRVMIHIQPNTNCLLLLDHRLDARFGQHFCLGRRSQDILANRIKQQQLPIDCPSKLYHCIQIAMALENSLDVQWVVVIRSSAAALCAHTTDETTVGSKLFIHNRGTISTPRIDSKVA